MEKTFQRNQRAGKNGGMTAKKWRTSMLTKLEQLPVDVLEKLLKAIRKTIVICDGKIVEVSKDE